MNEEENPYRAPQVESFVIPRIFSHRTLTVEERNPSTGEVLATLENAHLDYINHRENLYFFIVRCARERLERLIKERGNILEYEEWEFINPFTGIPFEKDLTQKKMRLIAREENIFLDKEGALHLRNYAKRGRPYYRISTEENGIDVMRNKIKNLFQF